MNDHRTKGDREAEEDRRWREQAHPLRPFDRFVLRSLWMIFWAVFWGRQHNKDHWTWQQEWRRWDGER